MSWILREIHRNLAVNVRCKLLLIELCQDKEKAAFWQLRKFPSNRQSNAISFEHRVSQLNPHCQTPLFITTSAIEYP